MPELVAESSLSQTQQAQRGACAGMALLDARYRGPLMSFFLRRVNGRAEAEDLTQEVFFRIVRHSGGDQRGPAEAYIFKVATNLLRDRARRHDSHRQDEHLSLSSTAGETPGVERELVDDIGPERVFLGREALHDALRALQELGERTRDIFILFRLESMRQQEIAALFGISVSAVEKHVVKALVHLGKRLG
jgi:RNA polymerase sigma-70 factor (ECF subfamily)